MITEDKLMPFKSLGVVAAAKALRKDTRTINKAARRLGFRFDTLTEVEQYHRERERKILAPKVRALAQRCITQSAMCEELGISRHVLRRVASENKININSQALW